MAKEHILVTGGAGFIGSNMVAHQLAKGHEVWAVDNLITGRKSNIEPFLSNPNFRFTDADLSTWDGLKDAVKWAGYVFHLAGSVGQKFVLKNPVHTITNNIHSCETVLKALEKFNTKARMLIISTSELYCHSKENPDGTVSEDAVMSFLPGNFLQDTYPVGKFVNEVMAMSYAYEKNMHCTIARIFNTIGVNQSSSYGMVVPTLIEQAINNKPLTVYGTGEQTRSFSDVRDTVTALDMLLRSNSKGEIVNVGNDKECKIIDLANLIRKKTQCKSEIVFIPYKDAYGAFFVDVDRRQPNLSKLKKLTGFEHKWTLDDTIDSILKYYGFAH